MNMAMKTDGTMEMLPPATMDLGYDRGEILLPTAQRADVVFIPQGEQGDELYLMWKDYDRGRHHMDHGGGGMNDGMSGGGHGMGGGHNNMRPSIRLMRMVIEGDDDDDDTYTLPSTLRPVEDIRPLTNDDAFVGMPSSPDQAPTEGKRLALQEEMPMVMGPDGQMQMGAPKFYIDGVSWKLGEHMAPDGSIPDLAPSARRVNVGDVMEWEVHNHTEMHHPFHAHGFSFQPIKWTKMDHHPDNPDYSMVMTTFPIAHTEWADTWNIPEHTSLHYKVRFDARNNPDGSPGGSLGRWLYHCHIFQHAGGGMMSEFVVEPEEAP